MNSQVLREVLGVVETSFLLPLVSPAEGEECCSVQVSLDPNVEPLARPGHEDQHNRGWKNTSMNI